jgi:hypothetical protein
MRNATDNAPSRAHVRLAIHHIFGYDPHLVHDDRVVGILRAASGTRTELMCCAWWLPRLIRYSVKTLTWGGLESTLQRLRYGHYTPHRSRASARRWLGVVHGPR